jgi:hypothetical protein
MANVVIVTKQCYLLCESINYIAVNEANDENKEDYNSIWNRRGRKKKLTARQKKALETKQYNIIIDFIPVVKNPAGQSHHKSGGDNTSVAITVTGRERCLDLFRDMVSQIREQIPDQLFLDKLVEKFLIDEDEKSQS